MNKIRLILTWLILVSMALATSGCSLIHALLNAGIAYGIYKVSN
jgi:hypothetical protein